MARIHHLWRAGAAMALVLALGACGHDSKAAADSGFAGHWTSNQWGEHYIVVEGTTMKVIYEHDDGRVVGTLNGTTFTGWWTEVPSRKPTADAGAVEFTLIGAGDQRTINGKWRYGANGNLRENWDLTWVDGNVPADIAAKFADAGQFLPQPA